MVEPNKNIKKLFRTPPEFVDRIGKVVRLDRNERTTPFPEKHLRNILGRITPEVVVAYPDLEPVYEKLSDWLEVQRNQVLLTAGSDTGIRAVFEVYIEDGDECIIMNPTYAMYPVYCDMFGAVKREVFYDEDFSLPVERFLGLMNEKTKLVALANPNHTGTVISEQDLLLILKKAKELGIIVLVDEVYYHFYDETLQSYISDFANLIIARTFSKAFGIAALRVGYLIAHQDTISQLYKVKLSHEITSISAIFVEYLIKHSEIMKDLVKEIKDGIQFLRNELTPLGFTVPETNTNFILAKPPPEVNGEHIVQGLLKKNICIKGPFLGGLLDKYLRITVGPVSQMKDFIENLKEILGEQK